MRAQDDAGDGTGDSGSASPEQRYDALFQEMLDDPDDLDVMFDFARVATQLGRFEPAISTLERMLVYNPNLPRVRLELGVLYYRIGAYDVAEAYFERVKGREDVPPAVHSRVDQYLAEIRKQESRHQFAGSLFTGARYETNANAGPDSSQVQARGVTAILDDQFLEEGDTSLVTTGFLRHAYDLETRFNESWETTVLGYATRHVELPELDVDFFELTSGPRLALLPGQLEDAFLRPFAVGHLVRLDRTTLTRSVGGGLQFSMPVGPRLFARADYELVYNDFEDSRDQPNASEREGFEQELRGGLTYGLSSTWSVNGLIGVGHRDAAEEFNSFIEGFAEAGARARYDAPFEITPWPWVARASVRVTHTDYNEPNPAVDPSTSRNDTEVRLSASNSFRINDMFSVELRGQHTINESNISNFEFDNTSVTLGGQVRF